MSAANEILTASMEKQQQQQQDQEHLQPPVRSRTLVDFWDDFYANETGDDAADTEWIVQPTESLFDQIFLHIPHPQSQSPSPCSCDILEIGCGTSTLARDLLHYLVSTASSNNQPSACRISMTATDVSEHAILQNQRRDDDETLEQPAELQSHHSSPRTTTDTPTAVHYQVWNVVDDSPSIVFEQMAAFDVVLDKGCLDTILFRTDKRRVEAVAAGFLNHVHQAMRSDDSSVYLVITPRRKHVLLQSYQGFISVQRHVLADSAPAELYLAARHKQSYLYVCRKRIDYQSNVGEAIVALPRSNGGADAATADKPSDSCPSCSMLERDFVCRGNDRRRAWAGHCKHCKLPNV